MAINDGGNDSELPGDMAAPITAAEQFTQFREPLPEASGSTIGEPSRPASPVIQEATARPPPPPPPTIPSRDPVPPTHYYAVPPPRPIYQMIYSAMPAPGSQGAPAFNETNASDFLRKLEDTCRRSGIVRHKEIMDLLPNTAKDRRVSGLKVIMPGKRGIGACFLRYTKEYLDQLVAIERSTNDEIRHYLSEFHEVSTEISLLGLLSDIDRASTLIKGLPIKWQKRIHKRHAERSRSRRDQISYQTAYEQVQATLRVEAEVQRKTEIKEPARKSSPSPHVSSSLQQQSVSSVPLVPAIPVVLPKDRQADDSTSRAIDDVARKLEALALKLDARSDRRNNPFYEQNRGIPSNGMGVGPPRECWTCGGPHNSTPDQCDSIRDFEAKGMIHRNEITGRTTLGTKVNPGPELRLRIGVLRKDLIPEQYAAWANQNLQQSASNHVQSIPSAPVQFLGASLNGISGHDYYSAPVRYVAASLLGSEPAWEKLSEDEEEYGEEYWTGPVNAIGGQVQDGRVRKGKQRASEYARTRNAQQGRFQPRIEEANEDEPMLVPDDTQGTSQEQTLQGFPAGNPSPNDIPRRVRGPQDPAVAEKRSMITDLILRKVWETSVTISIGELLGAAPRIRAGVGKDISTDAISQKLTEVINQVPINATAADLSQCVDAQVQELQKRARSHFMSSGPNYDASVPPVVSSSVNFQTAQVIEAPIKSHQEYTRGFMYATAVVGDQIIKALIDTGSAVNIIHRKVVKRMSALPEMRLKPHLQLTPVDGGRGISVAACLEHLPITISGVTVNSHTMVTDNTTNELLLGRLWASNAGLRTEEMTDGRVMCTIFNEGRKRYTSFIAYRPSDGGSIFENQLWPQDSASLNDEQVENDKTIQKHVNHIEFFAAPPVRGFPAGKPSPSYARQLHAVQDQLVAQEYRTGFSLESMTDTRPLWKSRPEYPSYYRAPVNTLYKRKADKVRPVNSSESDGTIPVGHPDWQHECLKKYHTQYRAPDIRTEFDHLLKPRISVIARGARLTQNER
ncbi:hypothetical protein N7509_000285 [Penicillium cosmopolitanum]|uniref:Uncharacterized protein n=1 Tax=Penicillium cosmopolitanum TaxID=1131564 RepID=A0A9X0BE37_9EURO|nr:uncharacterized protein N7509_008321 [Penicillium cosmopolitanum]XP_056493514.1 uncharacterized protein N7509_000285 [Penicillium cosmopolitanum]KAJ5385780.1 hypothetical protein N7509_008321 [Penicillium cosmopolitanum]KAJ5413658.1 hypothetical protein N7509_000285 [Penicillium cosmopolitanum]